MTRSVAPEPVAAPAPAVSLAAPAPAPPPPVVIAPIALETVDTEIWGPPLWRALHTAAEYSNRIVVRDLWPSILSALVKGIPCPECTAHYRQWYKTHPYSKQYTPETLQSCTRKWFLDLHNDVNSRQDPPVDPWTEEQVVAEYGGEGDRSDKVAAARELLLTLDGIIGVDIMQRLLNVFDLVAT